MRQVVSDRVISDKRTVLHISVFRQKNKRAYYPLSVLLFVCLCLCSCDRRDLTYSDEAEITITADWSKTGLSKLEGQYGATAVFYPIGGGSPVTVLMGYRRILPYRRR